MQRTCDECDATGYETAGESESGLIVAAEGGAAVIREPPSHPLAPARRASLVRRFATVAATRLARASDPAGAAMLGAGLAVE